MVGKLRKRRLRKEIRGIIKKIWYHISPSPSPISYCPTVHLTPISWFLVFIFYMMELLSSRLPSIIFAWRDVIIFKEGFYTHDDLPKFIEIKTDLGVKNSVCHIPLFTGLRKFIIKYKWLPISKNKNRIGVVSQYPSVDLRIFKECIQYTEHHTRGVQTY